MNIDKISPGNNAPHEINVVVENPLGTTNVKYELDKDSGALYVDRFRLAYMSYPGNYGFVPHTLSLDGDPIDVLVVSGFAVAHKAVLPCKPIGVLLMEDDGGPDEKIIAIPSPRLTPVKRTTNEFEDMEEGKLERIKHFFSHYKDGEAGKWVKIEGWGDSEKARALILESIERAKQS
ncbi:MAG: inorganic diphosphatase [bacterium]|nr:inorganic diphosphatase [bacterium]